MWNCDIGFEGRINQRHTKAFCEDGVHPADIIDDILEWQYYNTKMMMPSGCGVPY